MSSMDEDQVYSDEDGDGNVSTMYNDIGSENSLTQQFPAIKTPLILSHLFVTEATKPGPVVTLLEVKARGLVPILFHLIYLIYLPLLIKRHLKEARVSSTSRTANLVLEPPLKTTKKQFLLPVTLLEVKTTKKQFLLPVTDEKGRKCLTMMRSICTCAICAWNKWAGIAPMQWQTSSSTIPGRTQRNFSA